MPPDRLARDGGVADDLHVVLGGVLGWPRPTQVRQRAPGRRRHPARVGALGVPWWHTGQMPPARPLVGAPAEVGQDRPGVLPVWCDVAHPWLPPTPTRRSRRAPRRP